MMIATMTVKDAAMLIGKSEQFVRIGLRKEILPLGYAAKMSSKWTYHISDYKIYEYVEKVS